MTVGPDLLHQRRQFLARKADVLATDVSDAGVSDGGVDLARIRDRAVVARQHEDEFSQSPTSPKLSDNFGYISGCEVKRQQSQEKSDASRSAETMTVAGEQA